MSRKNLIISPTGGNSTYHKIWTAGPRSFDLMLVNYGSVPGRNREDADYYFETQGFKLEILKSAIEAHRETVRRYDAVWLPDDDLSISCKNINRLFALFHAYSLDIAQPGIANDFFSHRVLKRCAFTRLRYMNFIEMMCPLFKTESLFEVLPFFDLTRSGWGIDALWSQRLKNKRMAVLDEVGVIHTKPHHPDNLYYRKLRALGIDAFSEQLALMERYQVPLDYSCKKKEFYPWFPIFIQPFLERLYRRNIYSFSEFFKRLGPALKRRVGLG